MRQRIVHVIAKLHGIAELCMGQVYNIHLSHRTAELYMEPCTWDSGTVRGTGEQYMGHRNCTWDRGTAQGTAELYVGQQNCTWDRRTVRGTAELYLGQQKFTRDSGTAHGTAIEL